MDNQFLTGIPLELSFYNFPFNNRQIKFKPKKLLEEERNTQLQEPDDMIRFGNICFWNYAFDMAITYYEKALKAAQGKNDILCQVYSLINFAKVLRYPTKYDKKKNNVYEPIRKAAEILKYTEFHALKGRLNFIAAETTENFDEKLDYYKEALTAYQDANMKAEAAFVIERLACLKQKSNPKKSIDLFKQALVLYEELGDSYETARILNEIGYLYFMQKYFDSALSHFSKAYDLYEKEEYFRQAAETKYLLGLLFIETGKTDEAFTNMNSAIELYLNHDIDGNIKTILEDLFTIFDEQKQYKKALDYFLKLHENPICKSVPVLVKISSAIGRLYYILNDYDNAIRYIKEALENESRDEEDIATYMLIIGSCLQIKDQFEQALDYLNKSRIIFQKLHIYYKYSWTLCEIGKIYFFTGKNNLALQHTKEALEIAKNISDSNLEYYILDFLHNMCYILGDFQTANQFPRMHINEENESNPIITRIIAQSPSPPPRKDD